MALVDNAWYVDYGDGATTGYYAVAAWTALTTYDCGALVRQLAAPSVGNERVFVCIAGHVASGAAEPSWTLTRGAKTTDATITWQEATGIAALNGDLSTNTPNWTTVKNTAITLGQVIQNNAGNLILICTTAGTAGNGAEPSWAAYTTAGATTADNTVTWTTLGASFGSWAAPHARGANAFTSTWGQAGNTFYVASEHAETQASALTWTLPGTTALPVNVVCVTKTAVPPVSANVTTGATVTTTGNSNLTINRFGYIRGVTFSAGSGAVSATINIMTDFSAAGLVLENCILKKAGTTGISAAIGFYGQGANSQTLLTLINTILQFSATTDGIRCDAGGQLVWRKTPTAIGGTVPTTALFANAGNGGNIRTLIEGVDFSGVTTGALTQSNAGGFVFKDCKIGASVAIGTPNQRGQPATQLINVDSGATNYRNEFYTYEGTQTTSTAVVRTGGASNGTAYGHKIVTSANASWTFPFQLLPYSIWNTTTGSAVSLTIEGIADPRDFSALPKNDDIWWDIECLETSGNPLGVFTTGTKADLLATGSSLTASTQAWDSAATARANTTAYVAGNIIKLASNPGRLFLCTTAGTTAGSEPAGYASAVDGGSVTDNTATFKAMWRFKQTITSGTIQLAGPITIYPKVAKASLNGIYIDPVPTISGVTVQRTYDVSPGAYVSELQAASGGGLLTHSGMLGGMRG